jgi:hypothetical protein
VKTNLGIETTDQEREAIARTLSLPHKLATRNDIKEAIYEYVQKVLIGGEEVESRTNATTEDPSEKLPETGGDRSVRGFVPSRGDEPYLTQPKDPELAVACSSMLDIAERIDQMIWETIERNRK